MSNHLAPLILHPPSRRIPIVPEDVVRAIIDAVIVYYQGEFASRLSFLYQTLCSSSLVSRSFREVAQRHLFRRVSLSNVERSTKLLSLLRTRPALAWSIKVLNLSDLLRYEPHFQVQQQTPPISGGRLRRLRNAISQKVMKAHYKSEAVLTTWLSSPDGKELLSLLCHVQDMRIDQLSPSAYGLIGNLFEQMSHVQSLRLAWWHPEVIPVLESTYSHMRHLQSLTVMHRGHAFPQATSTGRTDSSTLAHYHRPSTLQKLNVEALRSLAELVDVSEHTGFLTSVQRLQMTGVLNRSELQQMLTIVHDGLPTLHHLDFKLDCNGLETTDRIDISGISSMKSLVIRSIVTGEALQSIVQAFSLSRIASPQDLNLHVEIHPWSEGFSQAPAYLSKLDHILSGKPFASLRTLTLSVPYLFTVGEDPDWDEDCIHQAMPLCYQRRVLTVDTELGENLFQW
jgi:hypothetical protein